MSGCECINCREATAMGRQLEAERRQDFEAWLAKRQDRLAGFPRLMPDHETAVLDLTHWNSAIAIPAVRRITP